MWVGRSLCVTIKKLDTPVISFCCFSTGMSPLVATLSVLSEGLVGRAAVSWPEPRILAGPESAGGYTVRGWDGAGAGVADPWL